jgi:hypothetical protein
MLEFNEKARFGLHMPKESDPENTSEKKRLTFERRGGSNNTCLLIDGQDYLFGQAPGVFELVGPKKNSKLLKAEQRYRWTAEMKYGEQGLVVTQIAEIVPGQTTRLLDTCLVRYEIKNVGNQNRKVGLRVMLDTFIGSNDGVPFRVPSQRDLLTTKADYNEKEVPDWVQAWERPDPKDPGTVVHLGLKHIEIPGSELDPVNELVICRWPQNSDIRWRWDYEPMNKVANKGDSCVVIYWAENPMHPGETREMGFTYGLNTAAGNADLRLTAGGSFRKNGVFTLTATVAKAEPGTRVKIVLPKDGGLSLADPKEPAEKVLDKGGEQVQVSWQVRGNEVGKQSLEVIAGGARATYQVEISTRTLFD